MLSRQPTSRHVPRTGRKRSGNTTIHPISTQETQQRCNMVCRSLIVDLPPPPLLASSFTRLVFAFSSNPDPMTTIRTIHGTQTPRMRNSCRADGCVFHDKTTAPETHPEVGRRRQSADTRREPVPSTSSVGWDVPDHALHIADLMLEGAQEGPSAGRVVLNVVCV